MRLVVSNISIATEYIDDWEKFNETSLIEKEDFFSHLNIENIIDENYKQEKDFAMILKLKN